MRKAFLAVFVCCTVVAVAQQVPSFKFGKISEADFSTKPTLLIQGLLQLYWLISAVRK
jgi:hypothetical protein